MVAAKQQPEPRKQAQILIFGVARVMAARKWLGGHSGGGQMGFRT